MRNGWYIYCMDNLSLVDTGDFTGQELPVQGIDSDSLETVIR